MIDSVSSSTNIPSSQRSQALVRTSDMRGTGILTAIQQSQHRSLDAVAPVKIFAVPQTTRSGGASSRLPRGSLVDILA